MSLTFETSTLDRALSRSAPRKTTSSFDRTAYAARIEGLAQLKYVRYRSANRKLGFVLTACCTLTTTACATVQGELLPFLQKYTNNLLHVDRVPLPPVG